MRNRKVNDSQAFYNVTDLRAETISVNSFWNCKPEHLI